MVSPSRAIRDVAQALGASANSRATAGVCASFYLPQQQPDFTMHRCRP